MQAAIATAYGPPEVIEIREVPTPDPKDQEVLIRVRATTVTSGDWRVRSLNIPRGFKTLMRLMYGFSQPRQPILGVEAAGEVAAVGKDVTQFQVGDAVFAYTEKMGCHAEYLVMPADGAVAPIPAPLSFEEAAALSFGGVTALVFFRRGHLQAGERVLVNGASGAVGTAAVQLAKHLGAEVTGVCSTPNRALVLSLGADHVIDYTQQNLDDWPETYDVILDTVGTLPFSRSKRLLRSGGRLLAVLGTMPELLRIPWDTMTSDKKTIAGPTSGSAELLRDLAALVEAGAYRPVLDRSYPFAQIVEAHRYVDTGRKKGNVNVTLHP